MTIRYQIEPMAAWPYPNTRTRRPKPFRANFDSTLGLLERELDYLDYTGTVAVRVVAPRADLRKDGMLRARAVVLHPGVALSFRCRFGDLTYPCDTFASRWMGDVDWQVNLRAIALGLEALRKLDRYGIAGRGEQYTGWRAIEATASAPPAFASGAEAVRWLREVTGTDDARVSIGQLLRIAALKLHPDSNGGDRSRWERCDQARQVIEREMRGRGGCGCASRRSPRQCGGASARTSTVGRAGGGAGGCGSDDGVPAGRDRVRGCGGGCRIAGPAHAAVGNGVPWIGRGTSFPCVLQCAVTHCAISRHARSARSVHM